MSGNLNTPGAPGQNTGHGHVFPRPDGARARCGGPALCRRCRDDATHRDAPVDWPARFRAAADVAANAGLSALPWHLTGVAERLKSAPPDVVEAIGRALSGQQP